MAKQERKQDERKERKQAKKYEELTASEQLLYQELQTFYCNTSYIENDIRPFVLDRNFMGISRRLVSFILSNLMEDTGVRWQHTMSSGTTCIKDLASLYNRELKNWRKKSQPSDPFDVFQRGERVEWPLEDGSVWITTLGLLVFFRWLIEHELLSLIRQNIQLFKQKNKEWKEKRLKIKQETVKNKKRTRTLLNRYQTRQFTAFVIPVRIQSRESQYARQES
jgi:hypothetical protein